MSDILERAARLLTPGITPDRIRTDVPHPARVYDYLIGGRDNYALDRDLAEQALAIQPQLRAIARENRAFLTRAVHHLVDGHGIEQFLDLGAGLPRSGDVTTTVRALRPDARIVCVDSDPVTANHLRARINTADLQASAALLADLRDPRAILDDPDLKQVLDFSRPIGMVLGAVLHYLPDIDNPHQVVSALVDAVAPGSVVVLSHATADGPQYGQAVQIEALYHRTQTPITLRTRAQIEALCDRRLRIEEPAVVAQPWWRPDQQVNTDRAVNWCYGLSAVKP